MPRRSTPSAGQQGFALVEVLVAAALLLVGMTGILTLVESAASTTTTTRTREAASALQREVVEAARSIPYEQMTPNALAGLVSQRPGLSDGSIGGSGWTVNRRNAVFTISVGVCTVDDPRDGTGAHEAGVFCRPGTGAKSSECSAFLGATATTSTTSATASDCGVDADLNGTVEGLADPAATMCALGSCTTPEDKTPGDYKRVISLVRWGNGSWNLQTTTVNSPGSAAAPAVTRLDAATTVTSGSGLVFTAEVAPAPVTVSLALEGRQVATASQATGGSWTATWNLGAVSDADGAQPAEGETLDGSHLLSAKGFDQYGQFGATRSLTVLVNRRRPFAPVRVGAGRNGSGVEIEWSPAKERDLEGHRVYRQVGPASPVEVCALTQATRCRDASPPADALVSYYVVGVDRDPALREGDRSVSVGVGLTNNPPPAPTGLSAVLSTGGVVLSWTAGGPDPDMGDAIDHYNVYRDGTGLTDRIDRTDATELTWTDTTAGGVPHDYWITAVDRNLAESPLLGPVRR